MADHGHESHESRDAKRLRPSTLVDGLRRRDAALFAKGVGELDADARRQALAQEQEAGPQFVDDLVVVTRGSYTFLNQVLGMLTPEAATALRSARRRVLRASITEELRATIRRFPAPEAVARVQAMVASDPAFFLALLVHEALDTPGVWDKVLAQRKRDLVRVLADDEEARAILYDAVASAVARRSAAMVSHVHNLVSREVDAAPGETTPAQLRHVAALALVAKACSHERHGWNFLAHWKPGVSEVFVDVFRHRDVAALGEVLREAQELMYGQDLLAVEACDVRTRVPWATSKAKEAVDAAIAANRTIAALFAELPEGTVRQKRKRLGQLLLEATLEVVSLTRSPGYPRYRYRPPADKILAPGAIPDGMLEAPARELPASIRALREAAIACRRVQTEVIDSVVYRAVLMALDTMSVDHETEAAILMAWGKGSDSMVADVAAWFHYRREQLEDDETRAAFDTYEKMVMEWMDRVTHRGAKFLKKMKFKEAAAALEAQQDARAHRWSAYRSEWVKAAVRTPPRVVST